MARFYLAGGTGLALQLGHRRSNDLDFFSETDEVDLQTRQAIIQAFAALSTTVAENSIGNLVLIVEGIRIGFFNYQSMLMFDNADRDRQPDLLIDILWFVVRDYFIEASVILSNRWFLDELHPKNS